MSDEFVPFDPLAGWGVIATVIFRAYFWFVRW